VGEYGDDLEIARKPLKDLYEKVFSHRTFTGRSGGMFGFEGLGCIYWHMVAKLLLAVQEIFFAAKQRGADAATCQKLGNFYYRVRAGIGFNKTPAEYGAFPYDPYSHTPAHAGARQPGMTGQVKEEILTRFGELGVCVQRGAVYFDPQLLRRREFRNTLGQFRYLDVAGRWQKIEVPIGSLAFTWCQVPITYSLNDAADPSILIRFDDGERQQLSQHTLTTALSSELFNRSGRIRQLDLVFGNKDLFAE
jgi:hypothetical protein